MNKCVYHCNENECVGNNNILELTSNDLSPA